MKLLWYGNVTRSNNEYIHDEEKSLRDREIKGKNSEGISSLKLQARVGLSQELDGLLGAISTSQFCYVQILQQTIRILLK